MRISEFSEATVAPDFCRVIPTDCAVAVVEKATELLDAQLTR